MVLFPPPEGPTKAIVVPGFALSVRELATLTFGLVGYANVKPCA